MSASNRILWFHRYSFTTGVQYLVNQALLKTGINYNFVFYTSIAKSVPGGWVRKNQRSWQTPPHLVGKVLQFINDTIKTIDPRVIVVNDEAALFHLTGLHSLDTTRGSVYTYMGVPVIVLDDILKIKSVKYYPWLYGADLKKLKRWYDGTPRSEPKFNYTLCRDIRDLTCAYALSLTSLCTSIDIETASSFITSIAYTFLLPDGSLSTWTIPLVDPLNTGVDILDEEKDNAPGAYWPSEAAEIEAWIVIQAINDTEAIKVFQNGIYDGAWLVKFGKPPRNYLGDTMHLWHCIWCEAPKALDFITSFCSDYYRYWKHEIKGEQDAKQASRLPSTRKGMEIYWEYNGRDTYWTAICFLYLVRLITAPGLEWALSNYNTEFRLQVGPCFAMSMRGFRADKDRQTTLYMKWMQDHEEALSKLRVMVDDPGFNPASPFQVASLLYDVLGARPVNIGGSKSLGKSTARSTDEKVLKLVKNQHAVFDLYIQAIWDSKKPLNNASKYGSLRLVNNRLLYQISMMTETGRASSKQHMFWYGTNAQNIPAEARSMLVADPGYMLFDADYSQSDAFFVAFESEDPGFIETMLGDRDSHCVHAAFFFKKSYEDIYAGYKAKARWVVHSTEGVRQNTKRIVHGSNYRMAGGTLYVVMGHDSTVATAQALGHTDAHTWNIKTLGAFCQSLINAYMTEKYPRIPRWFSESVDDAIRNGNKATVYGGRTRYFFGDIGKTPAIARELSAYFGQGGTAGNINRTLLDTYYGSNLELGAGGDLQLLLQTHDSITGQVPIGRFDLVDQFLTIMYGSATIKGRTFKVPVECEVGLSWKDGMIAYKPGITTVADIAAAEKKLVGTYDSLRLKIAGSRQMVA